MSRLAWSIVAGAGLLVAVSCTDSPAPVTSPPSVSPSLNVGGMPNGAAGENPHRHFFPIRADSAAKGGSHGGNGGGGGGGGKTSTNTGIFYHGGPVIYSPKVAAIYWSASTIYNGGPTPGTTGSAGADGSNVGLFLSQLGGSGYWNINTTYTDGGGAVSNSLDYTGYWADNTNPPVAGQNVSDAAVQQEVISGFSSGKLAYDPSTLYIVFSGEGVNLGGGFGTSYCAYHGYFTWNGKNVKYAVMPYVATYPSACTMGTGIAPVSDFPAAAEVNVVAHETEETATDQDLNAWYDHRGYENADKCAWKFGTTSGNSTTGIYNETFGNTHWLIQMNWVNAGSGGCLQSY